MTNRQKAENRHTGWQKDTYFADKQTDRGVERRNKDRLLRTTDRRTIRKKDRQKDNEIDKQKDRKTDKPKQFDCQSERR